MVELPQIAKTFVRSIEARESMSRAAVAARAKKREERMVVVFGTADPTPVLQGFIDRGFTNREIALELSSSKTMVTRGMVDSWRRRYSVKSTTAVRRPGVLSLVSARQKSERLQARWKEDRERLLPTTEAARQAFIRASQERMIAEMVKAFGEDYKEKFASLREAGWTFHGIAGQIQEEWPELNISYGKVRKWGLFLGLPTRVKKEKPLKRKEPTNQAKIPDKDVVSKKPETPRERKKTQKVVFDARRPTKQPFKDKQDVSVITQEEVEAGFARVREQLDQLSKLREEVQNLRKTK